MEKMVVELDAVLSELCEVGRGLRGFRVLWLESDLAGFVRV